MAMAMAMEDPTKERRSNPNPHVLVVPYPQQGHINPISDLAGCLSAKGINITIVLTNKVADSANLIRSADSISYAAIADDSKEPTIFNQDNTIDLEAHFERFRSIFSANLQRFISDRWKREGEEGDYPVAMVYDSTMPWLLEVAKENGMLAAPFFTRCGGVNAVCYHLNKGTLKFPYEKDSLISLPCLPDFDSQDLVRLPEELDRRGVIFRFLGSQFDHLENADWILFNTFHDLESEVLNWLRERYSRLKTIGPTFLLPPKDSTAQNKAHIISLSDPNHDAYIGWLDSKPPDSVVFVSFGSIVSMGKQQMEEIAHGLAMSDCNFLWVVRDSEAEKLPDDVKGLGRGLIVNWCYQPGVLSHPAVSCFLTHCGWNSTLEALSIGVPLVAMPSWTDQLTNAKFVEDVWGVGIRLRRKNDKAILGRDEIARCIEEAVTGEKGAELKRNSAKWKVAAREAVQEGGTSLDNVEEFVRKLKAL